MRGPRLAPMRLWWVVVVGVAGMLVPMGAIGQTVGGGMTERADPWSPGATSIEKSDDRAVPADVDPHVDGVEVLDPTLVGPPTGGSGATPAAGSDTQPGIAVGEDGRVRVLPAGIDWSPPANATPAADSPRTAADTAADGPAPGRSAAGHAVEADTRVLHIGDSHTVGAYGKEMDRLLRGTGAAVVTVGVAGSSPSWWFDGTVTRCGFWSRDANGRIDSPADWRTPRATPELRHLLASHRPGLVIVSLGANLIGATTARINSGVRRMLDAIEAAGARIVWVGPPNGRAKDPAQQTRLYQALTAAVGERATFIDSRPFTRYPATGGDGIHYGGTEGTRIAKAWAAEVFAAIQRSGD